jgi:hypothetical protein
MEDEVKKKQLAAKQIVRVGDRTLTIVNGQVLTSKEAKEGLDSK